MPVAESLGERMKFYEGQRGRLLMPLIPAVIRLDGKNFHNFTHGLDKPFDMGLIEAMVNTTKFLVDETNACIGYTQSDEISLVLMSESFESQIYFDGKVDKINSILAAKCSVHFGTLLSSLIPKKVGWLPVFDCRCFSVPDEQEAINALVWREQDATRNSIQMAGQANFSHNQMMNKSCNDVQEMLWQDKDINWNDYPDRCKRGTYIQRRTVARAFTASEIDELPPKHQARIDPDLIVERSESFELKMPPITKVVNIKDVVFRGAVPMARKKS